eukprot:jgi/Chlat1/7169/Chrsp57S06833
MTSSSLLSTAMEDLAAADDVGDPDAYALTIVQQYLKEHGYYDVLAALEAASGQTYQDDVLGRGSQLLQLVYDHMERQAQGPSDGEIAARHEESQLLRPGSGGFAERQLSSLDSLHVVNILTVRWCPGTSLIATGAADSVLRLIDTATGTVVLATIAGAGGLLSMDFHPKPRPDDRRVLVGYMDGSHSIVDASSGSVLQQFRVHRKYVARVRWSLDGGCFATASYDNTVGIYDRPSDENEYKLSKQLTFEGIIDGIAFLENKVLVVAVRADNRLHFIHVTEQFRDETFNMNANNDEHVSFNVSDISVSPDGHLLLVSTDGPRMILFTIQPWKQVRNFYGYVNEPLTQHRHAWHPDGRYIYATSSDLSVYVYDIGTQKLVHKLAGHAGIVRDLSCNPDTGMLATVSFDKTITKTPAEVPCARPDKKVPVDRDSAKPQVTTHPTSRCIVVCAYVTAAETLGTLGGAFHALIARCARQAVYTRGLTLGRLSGFVALYRQRMACALQRAQGMALLERGAAAVVAAPGWAPLQTVPPTAEEDAVLAGYGPHVGVELSPVFGLPAVCVRHGQNPDPLVYCVQSI